MGPQESSETTELEVSVSLLSKTPVVDCEINPFVDVTSPGSQIVPPHSLACNWYREQFTCSVHHGKLSTFQCMSCVELDLPPKESYHCSSRCFLDSWKIHMVRHHDAAEAVCRNLTGNEQSVRKLRSSGSWPAFGDASLLHQSAMVVEREGKEWIKVGSSKAYVPTMDDVGLRLKLESAAVDCSLGIHLSPVNMIVTDPVITPPSTPHRHMVQIRHLQKSSDDVMFTVLSYNVLSDLYATRKIYDYCAAWALLWGYRRQNLLREIIKYGADILCLQESDHFENFFEPQLAKCGYSAVYKKKTQGVYTGKGYVSDGCATFYRRDLFKEIKKYEIEFRRTALSVVEALKPELRNPARIHLAKDNIALVVVLEKMQKGSTTDAIQTRICVAFYHQANTHISADPKHPDVKLFQVANLVNGLEKIAQSQIPLLLCGDINSLPQSDPHTFIVSGRINRTREREDDSFGIYQHLKLYHSLCLLSAYASSSQSDLGTKEPVFTHVTRDFCGTLDYIFYTAKDMILEGLLELPYLESTEPSLPSPIWSSDHIALMARFRLKRPSRRRPDPLPLPLNPWQQLSSSTTLAE
ncbi:carbon catabolite repressor protein 4 homolog 1-like isoform X2 [Juglans microcarpa x Juglans regia]|uniref:carbon catabolite repressor protein 4 homolog 1-like isoform X2 n=1 Tax=Juglans microcarpa x Juglans regia TaxID=2249226 RepID=UPI001B7F4A3F|nr:carbon catabolite repressor protein 4 homolog 1-like isoform X2 [Juglans microcarpa x Juglans regia]